MKVYGFKGLAGCVKQSRSRKTGTLVGLYHAEQAGLDVGPDAPWATVCEAHGGIVGHSSAARAENSLPDPSGWCDACRAVEDVSKTTKGAGR